MITVNLSAKLRECSDGWNQFWFKYPNEFNVSLFRCLFGFLLLGLYLNRFLEFDLFFLDNGLLSFDAVFKVMPEANLSALPFYIASDQWILAQGYLHLFLIALFTLGAFGRSLTWLLFVLNLGLLQRDPIIIYGADLFANFWLFYFSFVKHNTYFSIWNLIRRKPQEAAKGLDPLSSMGVRLLQIHLCVAYAITGWEKLKGTTWWDGSAVWHLTGMKELVDRDLTFIQNFPILVGAMTLLTLFFEIYFCFGVWQKKWKYIFLVAGAIFHLSTALIIDLLYFCFVMILPYLLFLPDFRGMSYRVRGFVKTLLKPSHS